MARLHEQDTGCFQAGKASKNEHSHFIIWIIFRYAERKSPLEWNF